MERENIFEKNSNPEITTERIEVKIEYDQSEKITDDSSQSEANVGLLSEESGVLTDSGQASEIEFLEVQTGNEATQIDETGKDFFVTNMPSTSKLSQEYFLISFYRSSDSSQSDFSKISSPDTVWSKDRTSLQGIRW